MKIGEFIGLVGMLIFFLTVIGILIFTGYSLYQDYSEYYILKTECNQDKNKDLCLCYDGSCEVSYNCKRESQTTTIVINGEVTNSSQIKLEGTYKDFENRLCEIATKAKSKDWVWRYCNQN